MESEYTSSPTRPPKYHPWFTIRDPAGQEIQFETVSFRTIYAVNHWIEAITAACAELCTDAWTDNETLVITNKDTGHTLTIKEKSLEDIIEYEPTKEEGRWTPTNHQASKIKRLCHFWEAKSSTSVTEEEEKPEPIKTPQKPKTKNRHKAQKPAPDGQITVALIAEEYEIPANKARQILRKAGIQKPEGGWTFPTKDPMVKTIRSLFGNSS